MIPKPRKPPDPISKHLAQTWIVLDNTGLLDKYPKLEDDLLILITQEIEKAAA